MRDISMKDLIGNEYDNDYNPIITLPAHEIDLLEFNKNIKYSKYFNSKLLSQRYFPSEASEVIKKVHLKKDFGWVFINNSSSKSEE